MDPTSLDQEADKLDLQASEIEITNPELAAANADQARQLREQAMIQRNRQMQADVAKFERRRQELNEERSARLAA